MDTDDGFSYSSGDENLYEVESEEASAPEKVFRTRNTTQSCFLIFLLVCMLACHLVVIIEKKSLYTIVRGFHFSSGDLPEGNDFRIGVYPSVESCYAFASSRQEVRGFTWYRFDSVTPRVTCEFKSSSDLLERQSIAGRTAVVRADGDGGCGVFECSGYAFSKTVDLYDCDPLKYLVRTIQGTAVLAAFMLFYHLVIYTLLWTQSYSQLIAFTLDFMKHTCAVQVLLLALSWGCVLALYEIDLCNRRMSHVSTLRYGVWFLFSEILLTYCSYKITFSAYSYQVLNPLEQHEKEIEMERRKSSMRTSSIFTTASTVQ
eukprot:TRINITY_DN204_c4_g1_i1.p1 TRINITY_DN204_c4_g1~~TRINITY_DN204_c4_g1_i1.p1  ORF type:complete len:335 (+),score=33.13 TRINITY_DN204_c4_g1_i1:59-1006(+)